MRRALVDTLRRTLERREQFANPLPPWRVAGRRPDGLQILQRLDGGPCGKRPDDGADPVGSVQFLPRLAAQFPSTATASIPAPVVVLAGVVEPPELEPPEEPAGPALALTSGEPYEVESGRYTDVDIHGADFLADPADQIAATAPFEEDEGERVVFAALSDVDIKSTTRAEAVLAVDAPLVSGQKITITATRADASESAEEPLFEVKDPLGWICYFEGGGVLRAVEYSHQGEPGAELGNGLPSPGRDLAPVSRQFLADANSWGRSLPDRAARVARLTRTVEGVDEGVVQVLDFAAGAVHEVASPGWISGMPGWYDGELYWAEWRETDLDDGGGLRPAIEIRIRRASSTLANPIVLDSTHAFLGDRGWSGWFAASRFDVSAAGAGLTLEMSEGPENTVPWRTFFGFGSGPPLDDTASATTGGNSSPFALGRTDQYLSLGASTAGDLLLWDGTTAGAATWPVAERFGAQIHDLDEYHGSVHLLRQDPSPAVLLNPARPAPGVATQGALQLHPQYGPPAGIQIKRF